MNKVMQIVGGVLVLVGIMMAAGSAGDCDGKCMEQANTIGEMITIALIGMFTMGVGAFLVYRGGE